MSFVDPSFIAFLFKQATGHDAAVPELDTVVIGATTVAAHTDPRSLHDINTREDHA
jgi:hypothetical protein